MVLSASWGRRDATDSGASSKKYRAALSNGDLVERRALEAHLLFSPYSLLTNPPGMVHAEGLEAPPVGGSVKGDNNDSIDWASG